MGVKLMPCRHQDWQQAYCVRTVNSHRAGRRAGSTLVQYATGRTDGRPYVIRFFLDRCAFRTEVELLTACGAVRVVEAPRRAVAMKGGPAAACGADSIHSATPPALPQRPASADFLPQVEAVCDTGAEGLEDASQRKLPPCIVMERGEPLQDLVARNGVERSTAVLVRWYRWNRCA